MPKVLDRGARAGRAFIVLEKLELQRRGDYAAMGRMLAKLHCQNGSRFGWHRDNYIGLMPQLNAWHDSWPEFFQECRIKPQLEWARQKGFPLPAIDARPLLEGYDPEPSLLHGDLWSGNAGFTSDGPVLFDPAVYYGDREADLAMTELFGGFPREFYRAYDEAYPLDREYEKRKHLYNLYHLLNHLNIFGGAYLGQVRATLGLLGL